MIRFTIYTYLFKPINEPQEPDMFSPEVKVDESLAMKQELLGELFKAESKLRFSRSRNNGDGESKQFEHMIVAQSDRIVVMRLANTKVTRCQARCYVMILSPNYHRIVHKANPHFNRKTLSFEFSNGLIEKVKLNRHL